MTDPLKLLESRFPSAFAATIGAEYAQADPVLRRSDRADAQANFAMALAKKVDRKPRELAESVVAALDVSDLCDTVEIAGPGFVNFTLKNSVLAEQVQTLAGDERAGVNQTSEPIRIIVEYGGANVAKEMHVGHLRSLVIGDALARVTEFLGHDLIKQDHIGDWGTQFGMLIEHMLDSGATADASELAVGDLEAFYRDARAKFNTEETFAERSRNRVVLLQAGDTETRRLWLLLVEESKRHFAEVYRSLGVLSDTDDFRGESFYNSMLEDVAEELIAKGLARVDDGALCAYPEGFFAKDGAPLPLMVRKSDGGFGYDATDLAALRYRTQELKAERILYCVDARQSQHFAMVFAIAKAAGWLDNTSAEHVAFGSVQGENGKPFATRSGETLKLADLLSEATERAERVIAEKNAALDPETRAAVAQAVGIGAVKYTDLANDRVKDYVFSWDRMLAFEGNTAPYLQYAHARIQSILRKSGIDSSEAERGALELTEMAEHELAIELLSFGAAVQSVFDNAQPHRLCTYLFEVASRYTTFYEQCQVLNAEPAIRTSRLALSALTARVLATGLSLLGIAAPDRM